MGQHATLLLKRYGATADMEKPRRSTMDVIDGVRPSDGTRSLARTVSNIFRTRSLTPIRDQPSHEHRSDDIIIDIAPAAELQTKEPSGQLQPFSLSAVRASKGTALQTPTALSVNQLSPSQPGSGLFETGFVQRTSSKSELDSLGRPVGKPFMHKSHSVSLGVPTSEAPIQWQAVDVSIFSLGSFVFKGMAGEWQIAQVLPSVLVSRLELFSHVLRRGKATCTRQDDSQLHSIKMWLPEIDGLRLAR